MKDVIKYKQYLGSVHFSAEDEVFYGKIEGVDDLVTFEGNTVTELKQAFVEAFEDYDELCMKTGKSGEKSYKGSFNVRIAPDLHREAARKSIELGISLNQLVEKAIRQMIGARPAAKRPEIIPGIGCSVAWPVCHDESSLYWPFWQTFPFIQVSVSDGSGWPRKSIRRCSGHWL